MVEEPALEPASSTESVRSRASYSNSATREVEDKLLADALLDKEDETKDETALLFELVLLDEIVDLTELEVVRRDELIELDKLAFELDAGMDEADVIEFCETEL